MPDAPDPDFSIPCHTDYLCGYMDAVGRVLSTGEVRYTLTARRIAPGQTLESVLGAAPAEQYWIEDWSEEFARLAEDLLVLDPRDPLAFHLIDLINGYGACTDKALCLKLDCPPLQAGTIRQALYLLQLQDDEQVLIVASSTRRDTAA